MTKSLLLRLFMTACLTCNQVMAESEHPIDAAMNKTMEESPSTSGMQLAAVTAQVKWEAEIKNTLVLLKEKMTPEEWKALEKSQQSWEAFKELELKTQTEIFSRMEGTAWRVISTNNAMSLTKERAVKLNSYLEIISER